jgi:hypothetical protein
MKTEPTHRLTLRLPDKQYQCLKHMKRLTGKTMTEQLLNVVSLNEQELTKRLVSQNNIRERIMNVR